MQARSWHIILLLTLVTCAVVFNAIPHDTWFSTAAFSLASGASALVLMAAAALLGGRLKWIESALGGLDRVYEIHKWLGIWALALASFHFVFKAGMPSWEVAPILPLPSFPTRLVRQLSYVALGLIVLLALNRKIPYSTWRWWHKLSGPLFLIVVLHWLSFKSPIALISPAGLWLATMSSLGILAALYKLLLYPLVSSHAQYRISRISHGPSAIHLELMPIGRPLAFKAGQFAFLRMHEKGMREPHPFTIATAGEPDGRVEFVIRGLGDFTRKLVAKAAIGMHADLYAPFGRFQRSTGLRHEVWIGGGVGISPFIAWLQDPEATEFENVTLFYFFTLGREFPAFDMLQQMARHRGAELVLNSTGASDSAFTGRLEEIVRDAGPENVGISFCGPQGLLEQVRDQMKILGIPEARLRFEQFEFR